MAHVIKRMYSQKVFMLIKINLEKAYDKLNWNFVTQCLRDYKFPDELINLIHHCISTSSFKNLWNGDKLGSFVPSRGIRQGDPLSPYHFVICMDCLSHITVDHVAETTIEKAYCITHCLDRFCQASSQKINVENTQKNSQIMQIFSFDIRLCNIQGQRSSIFGKVSWGNQYT
uniref:Uncharacterized protein LOC113787019 n=1 Tax=Cicer arietinum TaxID=3827 RepID=A0A3Q7XC61_CICAR|nr:uncharacterized protein LOC113787019 [Cicer arietinum]